jgi:hypothetical protein
MEVVSRLVLLALCASSAQGDDFISPKSSCCDSFTLSSGGMGDFYQVTMLGLIKYTIACSRVRGWDSLSSPDHLLLEDLFTSRVEDQTISSIW